MMLLLIKEDPYSEYHPLVLSYCGQALFIVSEFWYNKDSMFLKERERRKEEVVEWKKILLYLR